jgi:enoyl-CoA hydratase
MNVSMPPELQINGTVATITLRRPEHANRLEADDLTVLNNHIAQVNQRNEVLVLRILSTGRFFCSGFNINQIAAGPPLAFDELVNALEDARPVTIAVIQGGIYGGATDLALACDFRIGSTDTNMFMPAAQLGLHFYQRGMERYVSRLGLDTAKRLFLTAERLEAAEMRACGFLTQLVPPEQLLPATEHLSSTLTAMAPLALLGMKKHLNRIARGKLNTADLQADMALAANSADLKEGTAAWAERRRPTFTGE